MSLRFILSLIHICPKSPKCEACPLLNYCAAAASGKQLNYPVKTKKIKQKDLYFTAFALENSLGEYYLEKRPSKGLLACLLYTSLSPRRYRSNYSR